MIRRFCFIVLSVSLIFSCLSCGRREAALRSTSPTAPSSTATATEMIPTVTEREPSATPTPSVTPSPSATVTPSPSPSLTPTTSSTPQPPALVFGGVTQDGATNMMLYDMEEETRELLTRFTEPKNLTDITWSHDGQWILFASTHDFIHSRDNERNIFRMRPDGSELEMLTGEYVDPAKVPAPYGPLPGRVADGRGACQVCAQGAKVAEVNDDGTFELPGVPLSATWARVVCRDGEDTLQGEVALELEEGEEAQAEGEEGEAEKEFAPITVTVESRGQGWCHVSLSRDGSTLAGVFYQWTLNDEGERQYTYQGMLYDMENGRQRSLECPEEKTLRGLAWSPTADRLVGTLSGEEGTSLWLWDAEGNILGSLLEIPNPEQETAIATEPAWSPDGSHVAFALRYRHWWEDPKYRTDIILISEDGEELSTLVESEWGDVARHPTWSADGETVFYQFSPGEPGVRHGEREKGDIWSVRVAAPTPVALTEDGASYLPAFSPKVSP